VNDIDRYKIAQRKFVIEGDMDAAEDMYNALFILTKKYTFKNHSNRLNGYGLGDRIDELCHWMASDIIVRVQQKKLYLRNVTKYLLMRIMRGIDVLRREGPTQIFEIDPSMLYDLADNLNNTPNYELREMCQKIDELILKQLKLHCRFDLTSLIGSHVVHGVMVALNNGDISVLKSRRTISQFCQSL